MIDALLDLWLTRLREDEPDLPALAKSSPLAIALRDTRSNIVVIGDDVASARAAALGSLRVAAHADLYSSQDDVTGWLAVDVPVPHEVEATVLIHRMIRRLYFAAVLHGLAEVPAWREAVQSLRLSYLQTRGQVTTETSESKSGKLGADFGFSFSLTEPISAKLTASEEVRVAQRLSASMQRLDLFEAEDQLLYDLRILAALDAQVDCYAKFADPRLPRWEQVRGLFKAAYATVLQPKRRFALAPVFVFELHGVSAVVCVLALLARAAAIASGQGARIVLIGDRTLGAAWAVDRKLGGALFRGAFAPFDASGEPLAADASPRVSAMQATFIQDLVAREASKLGPQLRAVLGGMASVVVSPR